MERRKKVPCLSCRATFLLTCAWVLWAFGLQMDTWTVVGGHPTAEQCYVTADEMNRAKAEKYQWVRIICLPDTVAPRAPKH